jgi:acetyl esterase/lipase
MAAIAYSNREPVTDLQAVVRYVRQNAQDLGIDENRIGLWAASGSGPLALFALMTPGQEFLKCAVLCYPYSLDLDGNTGVADAARQFGFVNPACGRSVDDISSDIPLMVIRAGEDEFPHLNESLDRFIGKALARNLPLTLVNHSRAPHAFDVQDDGEGTRETIRQILAFMRFCLRF